MYFDTGVLHGLNWYEQVITGYKKSERGQWAHNIIKLLDGGIFSHQTFFSFKEQNSSRIRLYLFRNMPEKRATILKDSISPATILTRRASGIYLLLQVEVYASLPKKLLTITPIPASETPTNSAKIRSFAIALPTS